MHAQEQTRDQISPRIRALCKKHGYSNYRLAKLSGLSQTTVGEILDKGRIPNIDTLEKICHAFGISLSSFFASEGEHPDLTKEEQTLVDTWESLSSRDRDLLMDIVQCFAGTDEVS